MLTPPSAMPPTVLLVDDHDLFRAGLRTLLESEGLKVVGDAPASDACFEMIHRLRPEVVLLDVKAQGIDALAATRLINERFGDCMVIALTASEEPVDVAEAIRAGVRGYMVKGVSMPELVAGIHAVRAGRGCIANAVAGHVLRFVESGSIPLAKLPSEMSDREIAVLRLVATGLDNNEIALQLSISSKTVKNHISSIFTKLGISNRVQAAVFAVRHGIA